MEKQISDKIKNNKLSKESTALYNFVIENINKTNIKIIPLVKNINLIELISNEDLDYPYYINFA